MDQTTFKHIRGSPKADYKYKVILWLLTKLKQFAGFFQSAKLFVSLWN